MNDSEARTFARIYEASAEESTVDRVEHAKRITNVVSEARAPETERDYCRANVAPNGWGYTPCMNLLPCRIHRGGSRREE